MITERDFKECGFECIHSFSEKEWKLATEDELPQEERKKAKEIFFGGGAPIPKELEEFDREFKFGSGKFRTRPSPSTDNPTFETYLSLEKKIFFKDDKIEAVASFDANGILRSVEFYLAWIRDKDDGFFFCDYNPAAMSMPELLSMAQGALSGAMEDCQHMGMERVRREQTALERKMNLFGEVLKLLKTQ